MAFIRGYPGGVGESVDTVISSNLDLSELVTQVAGRLGETDERPLRQIRRFAEMLGAERLVDVLNEAIRTDSSGGLELGDGRKRSLGGIFFWLAKQRLGLHTGPEPKAPEPPKQEPRNAEPSRAAAEPREQAPLAIPAPGRQQPAPQQGRPLNAGRPQTPGRHQPQGRPGPDSRHSSDSRHNQDSRRGDPRRPEFGHGRNSGPHRGGPAAEIVVRRSVDSLAASEDRGAGSNRGTLPLPFGNAPSSVNKVAPPIPAQPAVVAAVAPAVVEPPPSASLPGSSPDASGEPVRRRRIIVFGAHRAGASENQSGDNNGSSAESSQGEGAEASSEERPRREARSSTDNHNQPPRRTRRSQVTQIAVPAPAPAPASSRRPEIVKEAEESEETETEEEIDSSPEPVSPPVRSANLRRPTPVSRPVEARSEPGEQLVLRPAKPPVRPVVAPVREQRPAPLNVVADAANSPLLRSLRAEIQEAGQRFANDIAELVMAQMFQTLTDMAAGKMAKKAPPPPPPPPAPAAKKPLSAKAKLLAKKKKKRS